MARPSKKQLADRRKAAQAERRAASLDRAYVVAPWTSFADFGVLVCEACGQEQTTDDRALPSGDGEFVKNGCVVCGHHTARMSPRHESFKLEAALLMVESLAA